MYLEILLFNLAGAAMLSHIVLSQILRVSVGWRSDLALELFAVPNAAIMPDWGFRLLRAKYYILWRGAPETMQYEPLIVRLTFLLTCVTGFLMPVCFLTFLVGAFFIAR